MHIKELTMQNNFVIRQWERMELCKIEGWEGSSTQGIGCLQSIGSNMGGLGSTKKKLFLDRRNFSIVNIEGS